MKEWYSAQELADLQLDSLPKSKSNVINFLKKNKVASQKRTGRGGGLEYAFDGLPKAVQLEIEALAIKHTIAKVDEKANATPRTTLPALRQSTTLSTKDKACADARMLMAVLVLQYSDSEQMSQSKAIEYISALSKKGALPVMGKTDYNQVCATARASRGMGVGARLLTGWVCLYKKLQNATPSERLSAFAPAVQGQPKIEPMRVPWLMEFLAVYRNPNGLSVAIAYKIFATQCTIADIPAPSLRQVRTALNRLPMVVRERGRTTGSKYKQLLPYVKRDWNADFFGNNDVWVGDGHSLKLKVRHPVSGAQFTPELTVVMDAPSRYIVGFSLSYSESGFAVLDALRMGMQNHGVPAIYYSDNGSGQTNDMLDNEVCGVLPRLGITHATGIAGNPQGRGIIERFMQGVPKLIAQSFASYYGRHGDPETVRKRQYAIASYSTAVANGKDTHKMTKIQQKGKDTMPTWGELYEVVKLAIDDYNKNHSHRSLKGMTPAQMREYLAMQKEFAPIMLTPLELDELTCPAFVRVVQRGWIEFDSKKYFSIELTHFDKKEVVLYVNQHDASKIVVKDKDGVYLATAKLNGNQKDAFSKSMVESAKDKRTAARLKRIQDKERQIRLEHSAPTVIDMQAFEMLAEPVPSQKDNYSAFLGELEIM